MLKTLKDWGLGPIFVEKKCSSNPIENLEYPVIT